MVRLVVSSPEWPARFTAEASRLKAAFGTNALRIDHVGSTAVPGLAAKPVIDIQVSVSALQPRAPLAAALARLGYGHVDLGDFDRVYPFFQRPAPAPELARPASHHVHLCLAGSPQEHDHIAFRDALRASPGLARSYEALKRELAALHHGDTLDSREAYSLAKSGFIQGVLAARGPRDVSTWRPGFTPPWRFRAATPADAEVLAALRVEAMRPSLEQAGRFEPGRARDRFLARFDPRWTRWIEWGDPADVHTVAAEGGGPPGPPGEPAGFVVLRPDDDDATAPAECAGEPRWLLDHFYVRPAWQGGGLGSSVMRAILAETDLAGQAVRVGALRGSPANDFYRRHGFRWLAEGEWDVYHLRPAAPPVQARSPARLHPQRPVPDHER